MIGGRIRHVRWWSSCRCAKFVTAGSRLHVEQAFTGSRQQLVLHNNAKVTVMFFCSARVQMSSILVMHWLFDLMPTLAAFDSTRYTFTTSNHPAERPSGYPSLHVDFHDDLR
jgi:hypothetical protein